MQESALEIANIIKESLRHQQMLAHSKNKRELTPIKLGYQASIINLIKDLMSRSELLKHELAELLENDSRFIKGVKMKILYIKIGDEFYLGKHHYICTERDKDFIIAVDDYDHEIKIFNHVRVEKHFHQRKSSVKESSWV